MSFHGFSWFLCVLSWFVWVPFRTWVWLRNPFFRIILGFESPFSEPAETSKPGFPTDNLLRAFGFESCECLGIMAVLASFEGQASKHYFRPASTTFWLFRVSFMAAWFVPGRLFRDLLSLGSLLFLVAMIPILRL